MLPVTVTRGCVLLIFLILSDYAYGCDKPIWHEPPPYNLCEEQIKTDLKDVQLFLKRTWISVNSTYEGLRRGVKARIVLAQVLANLKIIKYGLESPPLIEKLEEYRTTLERAITILSLLQPHHKNPQWQLLPVILEGTNEANEQSDEEWIVDAPSAVLYDAPCLYNKE